MKNTHSVIILGEADLILQQHLIRDDGDEDLCFALYNPSSGASRFTGIIDEVLLPQEGERQVHGNVSFNSSYYERVLLTAKERGKGIAFLHSHPSAGFQHMSKDDVKAETQMAGSTKSMTGLPLLGLTTGNDGTWSARFWKRSKAKKKVYVTEWCESVRVLDNNLAISFNNDLLKPTIDAEAQFRTISAWGIKSQESISLMKIGIIGLGSVGSMVAEALARTGFSNFTLIDFDTVEKKNLDRLMNVSKNDIGKLKVNVIENAIRRSGTAQRLTIRKIATSIYEETAFKAALDCDVLFSCVDRPHARQVLNFIAYAHVIPVIDGGILVRTNRSNTKLIGADWKVQTVGYKRPCLECLGQFTSSIAVLDKEGFLDNPEYLEGADESIKRINDGQNVFAFSVNTASLEVLQLLSLIILPDYLAKRKQQFYHFTLGQFEKNNDVACEQNCYYMSILGLGDRTETKFYRDELA